MTEIAVEIEDASYVYPNGHEALSHINMKITKGERVALLGPNGAGKSTLLMLINGLYTPSKGLVRVFGELVNEKNSHEVRRKVGLVFQDPDDQLFCPTLWEDVAFGPLNMGLPPDEVKRRVSEALRAVGLHEHMDRAPHHLSVGEKKKAALATVLAMKPEILALDEPTANLDPKSRRELIDLINSLSMEGTTLIVATHDVDLVPLVANRVYVLYEGEVVAEGSVREVFSNRELMVKTNLEPPSIARLFSLLNQIEGKLVVNDLPLTVEEGLEELKKIVESTSPKMNKATGG